MYDKKAEAKRKIEQLIGNCKAVKLADHEAKYSERDVETKFIEPFLDALGWNPRSEEVQKRYPIGRKKVDYALQIGGVGKEPNIIVEAKNFVESLDGKEMDEDRQDYITYPEKVILYGWNSGVNWTVLTNFKELRVYNVRWSKKPEKALWLNLRFDEFLDDKKFEKIWALSREGVATGILDTYDTRTRRKPVDRQFLDDLVICRSLLIENVRHRNNELEPERIKECAQKILDRLVIMRAAEDLRVETADRLRREILKEKGGWFKLKQYLFRDFDRRFNSQIFAKNLCDDIEIDNEVIEEVVRILYEGTGESSGYLFDQIPADILGSMYEDYIGYILKEEGEIYKLEREMKKRKAEGIYYTPTYVVKFIVENTLGTFLKSMNLSEVENIRILDPACGSGSFLIRAQEVLKEYRKSKMEQLVKKEGQKIDIYMSRDYESLISKNIIMQNIYGVDLDPQAAEISSVNLSLKVLADMKEEMKLPEVMGKNIKVGNSLISNHRRDLKKYFENPAAKKPFNWDEEFPQVFEQVGFDVVIGNPPYINVENLPPDERRYYMDTENYETAIKRFDIYLAFIEKGLELLKNGGRLSFIVPFPFLNQNYAEKLRELILNSCVIEQIVDLSRYKVFQDAVVRNVIIVLRKENNREVREKNKIKIIVQQEDPNVTNKISGEISFIPQKVFQTTPESMFRLGLTEKVLSVTNEIDRNALKLGRVAVASWGARGVPMKNFHLDRPVNNLCKRMVKGENVRRYYLHYSGKWFLYDIAKLYRPAFPELFENKKIIISEVTGEKGLVATFDDERYYTDHSLCCCIPKFVLTGKDSEFFGRHKITMDKKDVKLSEKYDLKFVLGVINSTFSNFYFKTVLGYALNVYPESVEQLPIPKIDFYNADEKAMHDAIVKLVNQMLILNKQYNETLLIFQKILDNLKDSKTKSRPFGKYYFKEGSSYGIDLGKTEKLIDMDLKGKVTAIEVEDEQESLVLKAKYGDEEDLVPIIRIHIKDNELRKFFYYTMKTYLMEKAKTRMWGQGKIVDVVLNALEIPGFEVNTEKEKERIRKLMSEFFKSSPIKDKSLSEVEKEIQATDDMINKKVYGLYGLSEEEVKIVEESLH